MNDLGPSYGLWLLVFINSAVFILFAFSFFKPQTSRDWRSFGAFSAFIVALFAEMYGFPLTIFFLSSWLQSNWPGIDWFAHDSGHLPEMILGWRSNPHFGLFHLLSFGLIGAGFWLISVAWHHLWTAQRHGRLAVGGPYARIRHPQYAGFVLIMAGFLLQWPTLLTLAMFPVLVWMYARLARSEDAESRARFGKAWDSYAARVPAFVPRFEPSGAITRNGSHGGTGGA
ncbi:isoprenylcysteine carboxyl methyltransferase [Mameliella alba]|uniref:methyltransferase family protein n=1 Tax=Mameliella TaxID=1434019 RepID=UPI000B536CDC|nr:MULTISPECIES: isoprenylcysteine carboxylmethyltransferase family protein [Mameliella]OWV58875.1 isoprenylcysteine carboxyl methyltransferase [Mameliella alba]